jgi:hypothetical protein
LRREQQKNKKNTGPLTGARLALYLDVGPRIHIERERKSAQLPLLLLLLISIKNQCYENPDPNFRPYTDHTDSNTAMPKGYSTGVPTRKKTVYISLLLLKLTISSTVKTIN